MVTGAYQDKAYYEGQFEERGDRIKRGDLNLGEGQNSEEDL